MTNAETAALAVDVILKDLRERRGFTELMASIGDWDKIEKFMRLKLERELENVKPAQKTGELDFT